nr:hypothetical protein [Tanacetum cinerariifolium]
MKSSTTNVETPIIEEVFHEVFESFQGESSSSSFDEASTSHNVLNERLEDAYFDASTSFHDSSNVHTIFQMDVKTVFLNGIIKEEVYVGQPP